MKKREKIKYKHCNKTAEDIVLVLHDFLAIEMRSFWGKK